MHIYLRLHCRDLRASTEFYERIFWARPDVLREISREQRVAIGTGAQLLLVERGEQPATRCSLDFSGFDVMSLYERIREHIPGYDGPDENPPAGHYWGPYDYPGGNGMVIIDPDGHRLSFSEW